MRLFTVPELLQHFSESYVKGVKDKLTLAQTFLSRNAGTPEQDACKDFSMGKIIKMANEQNVKPFTLVQQLSEKECSHKAIQDLMSYMKRLGKEVYDARIRDKERENRGNYLSPTSLETVERGLKFELLVMPK